MAYHAKRSPSEPLPPDGDAPRGHIEFDKDKGRYYEPFILYDLDEDDIEAW